MKAGCLFVPDGIELVTQRNPIHVHSLHAQSHMRNDCKNKITAERVFDVCWDVRGCCWGDLGATISIFISLDTLEELKFTGGRSESLLKITDFWMINFAKILQIKLFPL
jgi:predicted small metal-binding protein